MAGSVNKVILVGHLGQDPEVRQMNNGAPVVNLSVATSERWTDKRSGERREKTEWHRIVIFNENLCKVAETYLKKGSKVYLEGQLQTRKWQADDGGDRYATEVVLKAFNGVLVLLDRRDGGDQASGSSTSAGNSYGAQKGGSPSAQRSSSAASSSGGGHADMDDEIPF
ncbi:single-stranded DNA-binding protein [Notoacmeibacter sp. MSK16QG-6]|uniref:single-stranded DNA-binding protein n=1 Tax=Notoacmeibacter sp. MSK16QG-6 TaxID=2957982 RepID=UPI0020A20559|nr:single-stranded DNA-binding protein [Notoacmeibacter sp. MSK16QG-6]MCP1200077.1 single-stranded DNA-binding protein [Notoacmeibacter sp. MSK16QG-6]